MVSRRGIVVYYQKITNCSKGDNALKWNELKQYPIFNLGRLLAVFLLTILLCYLLLRVAGLLAPFVLALICALAMEPLIRLITRKTKRGFGIPRSLAVILVMLIAGGVIGVLLTFVGHQIVDQFISLGQSIPKWLPGILDQITATFQNLEEQITLLPYDFPEDLFSRINEWIYSLIGELTKYANTLARGVVNTATALPNAFLFIIMWLLGTYYLAAWRPRIGKFVRDNAPPSWTTRMFEVRDRLFSTVFGYIRAQLILMVMVFFIILIGLSIQRIEYALLLAFVIAVLDALPVLGSGLFLNTWAVFYLLTGDFVHAVGLFLTWVAVAVGRNLLEPRLVSVQIGLPPLVTMLAMYAGFRLAGIIGLIAGPILAIMLLIVYEYFARGRTLRQVLMNEEPVEEPVNEESAAEESSPPPGDT